jgi:hypothetical protein
MTTEDNRRNMKELKGLELEGFCCCFCNGGGAMGEAVTLAIQTPDMEDDENQSLYAHRSFKEGAPSVSAAPSFIVVAARKLAGLRRLRYLPLSGGCRMAGMIFITSIISSAEWIRLREAAQVASPNEVLARGEIMRRFSLSGVAALKAATEAEKKKAQWEHQATMTVPGDEKLRT